MVCNKNYYACILTPREISSVEGHCAHRVLLCNGKLPFYHSLEPVVRRRQTERGRVQQESGRTAGKEQQPGEPNINTEGKCLAKLTFLLFFFMIILFFNTFRPLL